MAKKGGKESGEEERRRGREKKISNINPSLSFAEMEGKESERGRA
jgi:hypothetical protein